MYCAPVTIADTDTFGAPQGKNLLANVKLPPSPGSVTSMSLICGQEVSPFVWTSLYSRANPAVGVELTAKLIAACGIEKIDP